MKKALVLLLALAMVGSVFAEQAYTLSGYGQAKWGFNLNNNNHGFTNSYGITMNVPLVEGKGGATGENVYGKIDITGVDVNIIDGDADGTPSFDSYDSTVTATIYAGDLSVQIFSAPSINFENAKRFTPWVDNDADYSAAAVVKPSATTAGGLTIGYKLGTLGSVAVKVGSIGDATTYASDEYAFSGLLTLTPVTGLTVIGGGLYDLSTKLLGATAKLSYVAGDLSASAAMDLKKADAADAQFDASAALSYMLLEGKDKVGVDLYYAQTSDTAKTLDAKFGYTDASGFVPGLDLGLYVFAMDLLADPAMDPMYIAIGQTLSYKSMMDDVNYVKPYEKFAYDLNTKKTYIKAGVEAKLIANTVFTVDYTSGALANKAFPNGFITDGGQGSETVADKGKVTVTAKISF